MKHLRIYIQNFPTHVPLRDPILLFSHTFSPKGAHVGGPCPQNGSKPHYRKSWIHPCEGAGFYVLGKFRLPSDTSSISGFLVNLKCFFFFYSAEDAFSETSMACLQQHGFLRNGNETAEFSGCFEIELNAAYGYPMFPLIDHRKVHLIQVPLRVRKTVSVSFFQHLTNGFFVWAYSLEVYRTVQITASAANTSWL